jgi:hypothetical protein
VHIAAWRLGYYRGHEHEVALRLSLREPSLGLGEEEDSLGRRRALDLHVRDSHAIVVQDPNIEAGVVVRHLFDLRARKPALDRRHRDAHASVVDIRGHREVGIAMRAVRLLRVGILAGGAAGRRRVLGIPGTPREQSPTGSREHYGGGLQIPA